MRKLMWFTIGFAVACAIGTYGAPELWALVGAAFALLTAGVFLCLRHRHRAVAAGAVCALGLGVGLCWFCIYDGIFLQPARRVDGTTQVITLNVSDYPFNTGYRTAVDGTVKIQGRSYKTRLYLKDSQLPEPGDLVTVPAHLRLTTDGGGQDPTYHRSNGIFLLAFAQDQAKIQSGEAGIAAFSAMARQTIRQGLEDVFPGDTQGFAQALLLGDKSGLSYSQNSDLALAGISHVVAVSGLHLSIAFGMVYALTLRRRILSAILGIPASFLFAAVAGFTPSVVRAAVMLSLMLFARLLKRDYDRATALSFAVLAILFFNPVSAASASLQLSVGAVAGMFCFSDRLYAWMTKGFLRKRGFWWRLLRSMCAALSATLGATAFTAPIGAWTFGSVSLVSPLTNLLVLPVITMIFYGGLLACVLGFLWTPWAKAVAGAISWLIRYVLGFSQALAGIPLAAVYPEHSIYLTLWLPFAMVLLAVFLLGRFRGKKYFALGLVYSLALTVILGYLEPLGERFRITVLDVGQGQCVILQAQGRTFVVDCGGSEGEGAGETAARYLLTQGIDRIDGLILTHYDEDHISGAYRLMDRIETEALFLPRVSGDSTGTELAALHGQGHYVTQDLMLRWGQNRLWIFAPLAQTTSNESGLSVLFTAGEYDTLITGDMSRRVEKLLLEHTDLPRLDLLVAGHHGAKSSTGDDLLAATVPRIVAISVGSNSFGHPAEEVLRRIAEAGCLVCRTDQAGTLIFRG